MPVQEVKFKDILARMEADWQSVVGTGNRLLHNARSILASNNPATVPASLAPYKRQHQCALYNLC